MFAAFLKLVSLLFLCSRLSTGQAVTGEGKVVLRYCIFKADSSMCEAVGGSVESALLQRSAEENVVVRINAGDSLNLTCVSSGTQSWSVRLPQNVSVTAGEGQVTEIPKLNQKVQIQSVVVRSVPAGVVGSIRCAFGVGVEEKFSQIFIHFSGNDYYTFLDAPDRLNYFIAPNSAPFVIPCAAVSNAQQLPAVKLTILDRLGYPGCNSKPYVVPLGVDNCYANSARAQGRGQTVPYESYDPFNGALLSNEAKYTNRYICSIGDQLSAIYEPLKPENQLQTRITANKDTLYCKVLTDDPDNYLNALSLAVADCRTVVDCDLKRRPYLGLGTLADVSATALATGENWGRKISVPLRHRQGILLCSGVSDPSEAEEYFVQDYKYFFTGFDSQLYFTDGKPENIAAMNSTAVMSIRYQDPNNGTATCSVLEFLMPVDISFETRFGNGSVATLQPTKVTKSDQNGIISAELDLKQTENNVVTQVRCVVTYLRFGTIVSTVQIH